MSQHLGIAIHNRQQHDQWSNIDLPCVISIQPDQQMILIPLSGCDAAASQMLKLEPATDLQDNKVLITSLRTTVVLPDGRRVKAGQSVEVELPVRLFVDESAVALFRSRSMEFVDSSTSTLPGWLTSSDQFDLDYSSLPNPPSAATLGHWFSSLAQLQRTITCSEEFFKAAAKAVFDPGGMDVCMILLKDNANWKIHSSYVSRSELTFYFDAGFVDQAANARATLFHDSTKLENLEATSEYPTQSLVASPIFDSARACIGVVYGIRETHPLNNRAGIRPLEVQFVSMVAETISSAMIRTSLETESIRDQVLLEQAFPPEVVIQLRNDQTILEPRDTEITTLFCDMRNFTELANRIPPKLMYELVADVMDCFTNIVMRNQGVIIDYFGDGFSAFWNAPIRRHKHPQMACNAAFDMVASLEDLNRCWQPLIDSELKIGIGIHTGAALVGNSGSRRRIKYGPHGSSVVLAQRIESLCSTVGVSIVVSESTASRVDCDWFPVKICSTQLKGFSKPIQVYCLFDSKNAESFATLCQRYEFALSLFENGNIERAQSALNELLPYAKQLPIINFLNDQLMLAAGPAENGSILAQIK